MVDDQSLMKGLMEDLAQAKGTVGTSAPADAMEYFEPKALRVQGKIIGQKDMKNAQRAVDKVIDELTHQAGMLDEEEKFKMRMGLKKKFQQYQMMLLKQAGAVQRELTKRKADHATAQAMWAGLSSGISGLTSGIVTNIHDKKQLGQLETMAAGRGGNAQQGVSGGVSGPQASLGGYNYGASPSEFFGLGG